MKRYIPRVSSAVVAFAFCVLPALASADVVYNAVPDTLAPNYPSQPFQAQQTNEFGDYVHLGGTDRQLTTVTVTMSTWARYSEYTGDARYSGNSTSWTHPITVNIYSDHLGANGAPDTLLTSKTQDITIPWRPEGDASCPDSGYGAGFAWKAADGSCNNGLAFNATFDLSSLGVTLPDNVIVTFVYNTQTYGPSPIGSNGPYNSLNIAVPPNDPVTVGTDDSVDKVFWNTSTVGWYSNSSCLGSTLCEDTNWTPYGTVALQINATSPLPPPPPASCPDGTTQSLVETVPVDSASVSPALSAASLGSGQQYLLVSSGTWQNSLNVADTEYTSTDIWATHMNGYDISPYFLGEGEFDLQVNGAFVDWGAYDSSHQYSYLYTGNGSPVSLGVFDGDSTTNTANASWYGDNSGSLSVSIYACAAPATGASISGMKFNDLNRNGKKDSNEPGLQGWTIKLEDEHGHVLETAVTDASGNYSFSDLADGTYKLREKHQKGWKRISQNPKPIVLEAGDDVTDVLFGNAQTRKGERDDTDNDDDRDDQPGYYYCNGGRSDYNREQNDKRHQQPDNKHGKQKGGSNNNGRGR